ncbi:MAG: hypothetical protein ABSG83_14705 [Roseiarcus sp.]|jgi:hypothetical protein
MRRAARWIGVALLIAAPAGAQNYPACAKIEDPLAYNACLARQGPPAHATRAIAPNDADGARAWTGGAHTRPGVRIAHGRHGRMVLELSVGGASGGARKQRETR